MIGADWQQVEPLDYLTPFLQVIKSPETSGPITGIALTSVHKFLTENIIGKHCYWLLQVLSWTLELHTICKNWEPRPPSPAIVVSPKTIIIISNTSPLHIPPLQTPIYTADSTIGVSEAIRTVCDSVTQCKFEATYPASDECVLSKILDVLVACVDSPLGKMLTNDNVINVFQACYRIGHYQTEKGRDTSGMLCVIIMVSWRGKKAALHFHPISLPLHYIYIYMKNNTKANTNTFLLYSWSRQHQ